MEQVGFLQERIRELKAIAASLQEGAIHTRLFPEIDAILALPDDLSVATVGEREAVARQVREHEQTFNQLGYSLLKQLMPQTGVSAVFEVVQAADAFKRELRRAVGRTYRGAGGEARVLEHHEAEVLGRYSLSIGTPPVTSGMRELVARVLLGRDLPDLFGFVEVLGVDPVSVEELLRLLEAMVASSLHYCTAVEEAAFLREAAEFVDFEGGRIFNRVVITESPERVIHLIENHVFDKFGPDESPPVCVLEGVDCLRPELVPRMQAQPNHVFVARVTRIPHLAFLAGEAGEWRSVLGRLLLVDCSERARRSNTTIVYTLFPHVARTLRNVQTSFAGRPANTQLQLRRLLERFSAERLAAIRKAVESYIAFLENEHVLQSGVDALRAEEWRRQALLDVLVLIKLRRLLRFLELVASSSEEPRHRAGAQLRRQVATSWMDYFYRGAASDTPRTVVTGAGRGALTLAGEFHRQAVRQAVEQFRAEHWQRCRDRLAALKERLSIPPTSTDEIEAAINLSQLRALAPSQWRDTDGTSLPDHLARTVLHRVADTASSITRRAREGVDQAAFRNLTGGAAAFLKRAFSGAGLGALHGRLEDVVGGRVSRADRRVRDVLAPMQDVIRAAQHAIDDLKGELDPIAVGEVEAVLKLIERGHFYPTLILPSMAWTYHDVFPEKDFPPQSVIRVTANEQHEMDPFALLARLEEIRYLFRRFPEIFQLLCRSMLLVINSPHNPTGIVYRRETILSLLKIASEYGITVLDDNAYHKVVFRRHKAREGEACVAQLYEQHRRAFSRPVRLITTSGTTKGLQGAGDRTGLFFSTMPEAVALVDARASEPHQLSLFLTRAKLETGLAAKRCVAELEQIAARLLAPGEGFAPWDGMRAMLEEMLRHAGEDDFPVVVFETLLDGYEELLRVRHRGGSRRNLSESISALVVRLKELRLERRMRRDVEARVEQASRALERAMPGQPFIQPQGAFYMCVALCEPDDDRGLREFLVALSRRRKVDLTYAGNGHVRLSLGGELQGDHESYDRLGLALEIYLGLLKRYWQRFVEAGRDVDRLDGIFATDADPLQAALDDLEPLLQIHTRPESARRGLPVAPSERGRVFCIEEGRSLVDKLWLDLGEARRCETVEDLLRSQAFRVLYRRLLKSVYRRDPTLSELTFEQLENQYGPLACLTAYHERQLIDAPFRRIMGELYRAWNAHSNIKALAARLHATRPAEKAASLYGLDGELDALLHELLHAFEVPSETLSVPSCFDLGLEVLEGIRPHPALPRYLQALVGRCAFAGVTAPLNPTPSYITGATRRLADNRYGFLRRDRAGAGSSASAPETGAFRRRLSYFAERLDPRDYLNKAVQVGPFRMLLVLHKAFLHLLCDELRLFPQLDDVQSRQSLDQVEWDGVLLFGIPAKVMGDAYKTGYIVDRRDDGAPLPTAWVAREDATDYFGFLKKLLLTLHNERVKALGGMPVHGAMITITFLNGLRKTLVFSADSGTGKSETITAMMEALVSNRGEAAELQRIDILAGDMLSLWRGEDGQVYAFGTETGDFLRTTDITPSWQSHFGDLLKRGSTSNPDHPTNPRVTIPGICEAEKVLAPTRVNGFFYINNYEPVRASAVELSDDPHQVLQSVLVRGLRKNKGTSGDQPSLRASLEFAGRGELTTRYRHAIDELFEWQEHTLDGRRLTCLGYRDGSGDIYAARELVGAAFKDQSFRSGEGERRVAGVDYDLMQNLFFLVCEDRARLPLDRGIYDQIYQPLVSTFCGNPFVDPEGMDRTLGRFAETMRAARVHTGVIRTQLAQPGYEYSGPDQAARDVVRFLLEDEEVNARFQRNKDKVQQAMQRYYGGVLPAGSNLPVELEGWNLLLLEQYESTHVRFRDADDNLFTPSTPYYHYEPPRREVRASFVPAIAAPEMLLAIADICSNPDHAVGTGEASVELLPYEVIRHWNSLDELTYQVLLVNNVITLGSSETELARFPGEVRKARQVAETIAAGRQPAIGGSAVVVRALGEHRG